MSPTDERMIEEILRREGWPTFTDHPADRGGPTKGGITLEAWREFTGRPDASVEELRNISDAEGRVFYFLRYLQPFSGVSDESLRELLVDCGVNHGVRTAVLWIQQAAKVKRDGRLGPITLAAIKNGTAIELFCATLALRVRLYGRLVSSDPVLAQARAAGFRTQAENAAGWNNRAASFLEQLGERLAR